MKYIIWGTGPYCSEKIDRFDDRDIVAFVERERTVFRGRQTILPSEIMNYEYDFIVILSSHYKEIIPEIVQMGIECHKIIPGINCKPYLMNELELISARSRVIVAPGGELEYFYKDKIHTDITKEEDWERIRKLNCSERNAGIIKMLDTIPVGKIYGSDRGGSICRYYIDGFLGRYRDEIKGRVLEIGDRQYTERYGTGVEESFVLHFEDKYQKGQFDFIGDLRDGKGIQRDFYDCIICTQVLDFVEDIRQTPDILIHALRPGGKLLVSVSGISTICRYDMDKYGQYWNFTDKSIRNMFTRENAACEVWTRGNCKVACAFLQGMGYTELTIDELEDTDEDFQVVILAVVTRTK